MRWTVLSDNRTNDNCLQTEHGLSILLDTQRHRILLDTGASDIFIRNAGMKGIDLSTVDYVFISHGHSDHAGGLRYFMKMNSKAKVIVSPYALNGKFFSKRNLMHSITALWPENMQERLLMIDHSCEIENSMFVISHIPQNHPAPKGNCHLFVQKDVVNGSFMPDDFRHELAMYVDGFLFTGCAHSGLENILSACPWPINTVVGGFHLLDGHEMEEELSALGKRLIETYPNTEFYTGHCTGESAFSILKNVMGCQLHLFCL